jgi:hypothetical protein
MKQKVRILLAYFRGFGVDRLNTYINFDYNSISDWSEIFEDPRGNEVKPPSSIIQILENLIDYKMKDFHKHNEYDWDEYWTLFVNIYPKENRINFQSECKVQHEEGYEFEFDLQSSEEMARSGDKTTLPQNILDEVNKVFNQEIYEEENEVIFHFDGSYDEITVDSIFEIDGDYQRKRPEPWVNLLDKIMRFAVDRWWNEGPGNSGKVKIVRNESLVISGDYKSQDYEMTDMNINVTPDSFE